jgi:cupin superfamily acireductone dioxygenase involved in methionine salvage
MLELIRRKVPAKGTKINNATTSYNNENTQSNTGLESSNIEDNQQELAAGNWKIATQQIQTQVDYLQKLQNQMANYLQGVSKSYGMVLDEVLSFKKNMAAQDNLLHNLVQYMVHQERGMTNFLVYAIERTTLLVQENIKTDNCTTYHRT